MGLAELQQALARLYTDSAFRERFFAEPDRVAEELGLQAGDARQLAALSASQVHRFAGTLHRKRLGAARKLLPLTGRVLGGRFEPLFQRYLATRGEGYAGSYRVEAIGFAAFLAETFRAEDPGSPWIPDLVRYESAALRAHLPGARWTPCACRHYPHALTRAAAQYHPRAPPTVPRRPTLALWIRFGRRGQLRHFLLGLPWP
jgi:hypothetical protein